MAKCKYCEEPIEWKRDADNAGWQPLDPETGERHECSEYEEPEREVPTCNFCGAEITFKRVNINHGESTADSNDIGESKWIPHELDGSKPHSCVERRKAWLAQQSQRTGRSEAQPCRNGCGVLVFWNYDQRSKANNKPLPFEQATNAYHKCKNYNPAMRRH